MPWCPKCKYEFTEGFTYCNQCEVELVEKLEPTYEMPSDSNNIDFKDEDWIIQLKMLTTEELIRVLTIEFSKYDSEVLSAIRSILNEREVELPVVDNNFDDVIKDEWIYSASNEDLLRILTEDYVDYEDSVLETCEKILKDRGVNLNIYSNNKETAIKIERDYNIKARLILFLIIACVCLIGSIFFVEYRLFFGFLIFVIISIFEIFKFLKMRNIPLMTIDKYGLKYFYNKNNIKSFNWADISYIEVYDEEEKKKNIFFRILLRILIFILELLTDTVHVSSQNNKKRCLKIVLINDSIIINNKIANLNLDELKKTLLYYKKKFIKK